MEVFVDHTQVDIRASTNAKPKGDPTLVKSHIVARPDSQVPLLFATRRLENRGPRHSGREIAPSIGALASLDRSVLGGEEHDPIGRP